MSSDYKEEQFRVLKKLQRYLNRRLFAHHPDCDQYDHHIFKIGEWAICVGDAGVYSAISILAIFNFFNLSLFFEYSQLTLLILGLLFFTPAIVQLQWKSREKKIKFMMRFFLGISIYYLLLFTFRTQSLQWKIANLVIFVGTALLYSSSNSKKHLIECHNCVYGENYHTCSIRFQKVLSIEGIEKIRNISKDVDRMLLIQEMKQKGAE